MVPYCILRAGSAALRHLGETVSPAKGGLIGSGRDLVTGRSECGRDAGEAQAHRVRIFHAVLARIELAGRIQQVQIGRDLRA